MSQVPYLFTKKSDNGLFDKNDLGEFEDFFIGDEGADLGFTEDTPAFNDNEWPTFDPGDMYESFGPDVIFVNDNGDTVDESGNVLISAAELDQVAAANPGNEAAAVVQVMQTRAPNWVANINDTNALLVAASSLVQNVKAVAAGRPVSYQTNQVQPYTRRTGLTTPPMSQTTILLIGAALLAFLLLRKKS